ncbi:hypothetical protein CTI12_AA089630 [Artemisia annua]|uniref:Uncharacterized protein n=1 Tax=Artemisia annua TaxID=35608 RepID=A0A2U1Q0G6_ARTAN|nr:hypothetical protein CTI12_AA089630 [Artemisia annua]
MPIKMVMEIEAPSPVRYLIGSAIMMIGVVLPLGFMMFRNKRDFELILHSGYADFAYGFELFSRI